MHKPAIARDQAEGLRRLLHREGLRVIRMIASRDGVGQTACALDLAAALAENGRSVLILDENDSSGNVGERLGLRVRHDLLDVLQGVCDLDQALSQADNVALLAVGRALDETGRITALQTKRLIDCAAAGDFDFDTVIIDSRPATASRLQALALKEQEDILVLGASAAALTAAYALLKTATNRYGCRRKRVLINKVRDETQARMVFANLAGAARRYLGVELELLGLLPVDEAIRRSNALGRPVIAAFGDSVAAMRFRQFAAEIGKWPRIPDAGIDLADVFHEVMRCCATSQEARDGGIKADKRVVRRAIVQRGGLEFAAG